MQTIYYLGNITYFQYFHNYLYIGNLIGNISEGGEVVSNLAIPLYFEQLLVLIDLPIIIYIFYKQHDIKLQSNYKFQILMPIIIFISLISTSIYNKNSPYHIFQDKWAGIIEIIQKFGLFALQITDWKLTDTSKIEFKYGDVLEVKNLNGVVKAKKNIIVIQVEALDASIINYIYNNEEVTKYLNSLTKKAIYFKYAMSYHLGGGTSDSEFSIINNTYPLVNTPAIKSTYYKFENSFVKLLHNAGYLTLAFHNNDSKFYNRGHSYKKWVMIIFWLT